LREVCFRLEARAAENGIRLQKGSPPNGESGEAGEKEAAEISTVTFKGDINEELVRLKTHVVALGQGRARARAGR
jgi:uncharacterized protein YicC (UPF0701 family)